MLQLKNENYLKNGKNYLQCDKTLAVLIFSEGYMYKSLTELFFAFSEETKSLSKEKKEISKKVKDWSYAQVICSILVTLYNERSFSTLDWQYVYNYILFSRTVEISNTVFLFLKENYSFAFSKIEKFDLYSAAVSSLVGTSFFNVDDKKLINFLKILKVTHHEKKKIISECLESNSYNSLKIFVRRERTKLLNSLLIE